MHDSQKGIAMTLRTLVPTLLLALAATCLAQVGHPLVLVGDTSAAENASPVLEIVTRGHTFDLSADEIASGWTTIRLRNESDEPHFALFGLMPEGRGMEDSVREVVPVFQDAMDLIMAGDVEEGFAALGGLPEWYGNVVYSGGPGMVSPGGTTEVVAFLEPGTYVIECYVKTEDGVFHSVRGMIDEITVADVPHAGEPPAADLVVSLSNPQPDDGSAPESGIEVEGTPAPGPQVVEVRFTSEDPPLLANDLHLVRLAGGEDVADVAAWMDWSNPGGLKTPAPATFLGGTHEMPQGQSAYLSVDLQPGRYAWVSERAADAPLYQVFEVR
ncbi:MAG: hypothetical protein U5K81_13760 [Trueperaceae bacterium]|nr:hypothetical protein [Trueperaceae bacterium]